jgi:hypothetical protein
LRDTFPGIRFDGKNLGGQARFVVLTDSNTPNLPSTVNYAPRGEREVSAAQSFTPYLIETLEARKEELKLDCYTISAATMENVFLCVVWENDAEEDERVEEKH